MVVMVAVVTVAVVVVVIMAVELLVNGVWVIGLLSDVMARVVVALKFVVPISSFVLAEALSVGIGVEVLTAMNVNVSAAVMTALEFPMPIP